MKRTAFERYLIRQRRNAGDFSSALNVRTFLAQLLERAEDLAYLRRYAEACPVSGAKPEHYAAKVLQVEPTCSVIAAIHFRGRATDFPFVDVSAQSGPLPRPLPLALLAEPFARFQPRAVRIWRFGTDAALIEDAENDLMVVGGSVRALQTVPDLPGLQRIRLEQDPGLAWYSEYRRMYEAVPATALSAGRFVGLETQSSLAECAAARALFRVLIDDAPAGVIAARPDSYRHWRGWHIVEEVLHPDFRGRRFAAAMQQAFLRRLDPDREAFVFGTIAAANTPSLKTALRVGRRVAEIGAFVRLDSEP